MLTLKIFLISVCLFEASIIFGPNFSQAAVPEETTDKVTDIDSKASNSTESGDRLPGWYGGMSGFIDIEGKKHAAKLGGGIDFEFLSTIEIRVALSFLIARAINTGFESGVRAKLPIAIFAPFIGGGGYWGENRLKCAWVLEEIDCESTFVDAKFTELGTYIYNISIFYRKYNIKETDQDSTDSHFLGIGFHFRN